MSPKNKKLAGRGGSGRNQGRKPNTAKGIAAGRTVTITVKVSPDACEQLRLIAEVRGETLSAVCAAVLTTFSESMK